MSSIHPFKVEGIEGKEIDFSQWKGKKVMIVNVASECGYTPQYQQLQALYEAFQHKLAIVGFPCNDFGGQEPGDEEEIKAFCTKRYGVTFPLAAKITIRGANAHPIYNWLTQQSQNGVMDSEVSWNFQKYLLDENGYLVKILPPSTNPLDEQVLDWLQS